jgi:hypothetical protein
MLERITSPEHRDYKKSETLTTTRHKNNSSNLSVASEFKIIISSLITFPKTTAHVKFKVVNVLEPAVCQAL